MAMARRLAVRLYWMWRKGWDYEQWKRFGPHAQPQAGSWRRCIGIRELEHGLAGSRRGRGRVC